MTNRRLISRAAAVVIILAMALTATIFVSAATPTLEDNAERIITAKLQAIGVEDGTVPGFYLWAFGKISSCMEDMDEAMQSVGFEHDMAGLFQDAVDSTFEEFSSVQTDEEALDKLGEIINEVGD